MSKSKHTPGPWQAMDWFDDGTTRWVGVAGTTDREVYDFCIEFVDDGTIPEEEQEANAAIIANAPAMRNAIINTLRRYDDYIDGKSQWDDGLVQELREAIGEEVD